MLLVGQVSYCTEDCIPTLSLDFVFSLIIYNIYIEKFLCFVPSSNPQD